jgi:polysaccharide transporter, PST family
VKLKSQFFRSSSWSFSAVVFRALGGLTINKLFAVFLGTSGITLLSHFQNLISLFTILPSEGVNRGIMKFWSDPKLEDGRKKQLFQTGFWITNLLMLLILAVLLWYRGFFFDRFIEHLSTVHFLIIFVPAVFLTLMTAMLNAVILSHRDVKNYALISIAGVILLTVTVYFGITKGNLDQALLSFVVGYSLMFFCTLAYFIKHKKTYNLSFKAPDKKSSRMIWSFIIMAVSSIVFGKLLDFGVRDYMIEEFGVDRTGLWQSVVKMSTAYLLVFTGTVGVVYYPKMASLIHDNRALKFYVQKVMGFVAFVTILCLGIYYYNKGFFLNLFFASGFDRAAYLVRYQVIGDFFCIMSYLLAYLLSARVQTWKYIKAQFFSAVIYLSLISLLLEQFNLEALTMAHMWRYIGFFVILVIYNRRLLFR